MIFAKSRLSDERFGGRVMRPRSRIRQSANSTRLVRLCFRAARIRCDVCSNSSNSSPPAIWSASLLVPLLVELEHRQRVGDRSDPSSSLRLVLAFARGRTAASGPPAPAGTPCRAAAALRRPADRRSACHADRRRRASTRRRRRTSVTWCRETCGSEMTMSRPSSRPIVISV